MKLPKVEDTHTEEHKPYSNLRDIILGGQDGLVNVLGIILGLAIASGDLRIILAGGLAATFAESVSMAAVAYTSTRAQQSYYESELQREKREIKEIPEAEKEEIREIYRRKGFSGKLLEDVVEKITSNEEVWLDEMMKFELGLQPVETKSAFISSAVVGLAAVVGSLIPLIPFFFLNTLNLQIGQAIWVSLVISAITLFIVGAYKARATIGDWRTSGVEIAIIGIVAALIGYVVGLLFKAPAG
jgi:predicted membrane protein (TIGR00267 family)